MTEIEKRLLYNVRIRTQEALPSAAVRFTGCTFDACSLAPASDVGGHLRISGVELRNCKVVGGVLYGAWLKNCVFDNLRIQGHLAVMGCIFENVTISGKVRQLLLNDHLGFTYNPEPFREAIREVYDRIPLALDISGLICPDLDIRGVPSRLLRLNQEEQFVVRKASLDEVEWRSIDYADTHYGISLKFLEESDWEDVILSLPVGKRRARALEVIAEMRAQGIVR